MKKFVLLGLFAAAVLTGCAGRYNMTLTNGNIITTRGKPKLDDTKRVYLYKDSQGRPGSVPVFRVQEIEPL